MNLDTATLKKLALLVAGGVCLAWLLQNLSLIGDVLSFIWGILFPFLLGFIIAFLLNIPMRAIERRLFRGKTGRIVRVASFTLTVVVLLAVIFLVIFLVIPELVATIAQLASAMPGYLSQLEAVAQPYLEYLPQVQEWLDDLNIDWQSIVASVTNMIQSGAGNFFSSTWNVATSIINGFVSFFIGLVFMCYLLLDKEHLTAQFSGLLKAYIPQKHYDKLVEISQLVSHTYTKFVSGQCIEALIITVMYFVSLTAGGFEYALLISVLVGFTSFIPMVGTFIGCVIGAFLLLVSMGFFRALIFVILFIVIQQIEGNLIYPHVVGSSVGLPPVWMLFAVTVGGGLAGVLGMVFFIPLFSVVYTLIHRDATGRLKQKGIPSPVSQLPPKPTRKRKFKKPSKDQDNTDLR